MFDLSPTEVQIILLGGFGLVYTIMKLVGRKSKQVDEAADRIGAMFMTAIAKGEVTKKAMLSGSKPATKDKAKSAAKKDAVKFVTDVLSRDISTASALKRLGLNLGKTAVGNIVEDMFSGSKKFSGFNPKSYIKLLV